MREKLRNGDIYDLGSTVNGVSRFVYIEGTWYYFEERLMRVYEYDQKSLQDSLLNVSGIEESEFIGNIFDISKLTITEEEIEQAAEEYVEKYGMKGHPLSMSNEVVTASGMAQFTIDYLTKLKTLTPEK